MREDLVKNTILSYLRFYSDHVDIDALESNYLPDDVYELVTENQIEFPSITKEVWLALGSSYLKQAMVIAATGWALEREYVEVLYLRTPLNTFLQVGNKIYSALQLNGVVRDYEIPMFSIISSEDFFNAVLLNSPDEVDLISAFTITKQLPLYPFEPKV